MSESMMLGRWLFENVNGPLRSLECDEIGDQWPCHSITFVPSLCQEVLSSTIRDLRLIDFFPLVDVILISEVVMTNSLVFLRKIKVRIQSTTEWMLFSIFGTMKKLLKITTSLTIPRELLKTTNYHSENDLQFQTIVLHSIKNLKNDSLVVYIVHIFILKEFSYFFSILCTPWAQKSS